MGPKRGEARKSAVLSERMVRNIRKAREMGISLNYLAAIYHVSKVTIHNIEKLKSWDHVK